MNPENKNTAPVSPNQPVTPSGAMPTMQPVHEERALGPAIGVVIIIFVLVLGGLYFWGQRMNVQKIANEQMQADTITEQNQINEADPRVLELQTQSNSDSIDSIDADLRATNTADLGTEVDMMNGEANAQ